MIASGLDNGVVACPHFDLELGIGAEAMLGGSPDAVEELAHVMLRLAGDAAHPVHGCTPVDSDHRFAERAEMLRYYTVLAAEARPLADEIGI